MTDDDLLDRVYRQLADRPTSTDQAAAGLARRPGVYAWWAFPTVLQALPGVANPEDGRLRLLYVGQGSDLRGRIMKTDLRRSGKSLLRRTLAGLLMPVEGYATEWRDGVVLVPEDEARLTSWMRNHLRLTWAEYPYPETVESDLVERYTPALNLHGVPESRILPLVTAARDRYEASAQPE